MVRVPPGETILTLGRGEQRQEKTFQVAAGETIHWPVQVDRNQELILRLKGPNGRPLGHLSALVRHETPHGLWMARVYPAKTGVITISGAPMDSVDVHILGTGETAPLSLATFSSVPVGELTTLDVSARAVPTARLRIAPLEPAPGAQRLRHIFAFEEGQRFGALLDLKLSPDSIYEFSVPARPLRIELGADRALRSVIPRVEPAPGELNDLGVVPLTELGELVVGPLPSTGEPSPHEVRLYRTTDPLDLRMVKHVLAPDTTLEEQLPAGTYRVEWWNDSVQLGQTEVEVRAKERAITPPPPTSRPAGR